MFNYLKLTKITLFIGLISFSLNFTVLAQNAASEVKLSTQEQTNLNQGKVILKGEKGAYLGQVLATGNLDTAWQVLTDYNNFPSFMPNIASSKIVVERGDRKIFEQVNVVDLLFFKEKFTVQIEAKETKPYKVDFQQFQGDLKSLSGTWQIKQINSRQILVTHRVKVEPESNTEKPFFYGIYESYLENTLKAIAQEITQRSQSSKANSY
ncbi:MAG TPA: SRPBCC family protein [Coleofasciculaceae cyanobacterium]|jgi:ribosome-associated toxin RatA of RatAB toxin-antitoxin module